MHLCLVEDTFAGQFLPLTHFHPVYDLRCGILTLQERVIRYLRPSGVSLHCRTYLSPLVIEENAGAEVGRLGGRQALIVNGRCLMTPSLARILRKAVPGIVYMTGEEFVAALIEGPALDAFRKLLSEDAVDPSFFHVFDHEEVDALLLHHPWDLISLSDQVIEADATLLAGTRSARSRSSVHRSAVLLGKRNIHLGAGSTVGPHSVLDATQGPIYIGHRVTIHPLAVIEGPAAVGDGAVINAGARVLAGTIIGPVCKVGGEIQHSILHSHANKQHDGFLGHSYLGPWVNLGAGTTTSNLKNTYGSISVRVGHRKVDTGLMFLGLIAGDHLRTGINVSLETGTVAGVSSNIFGAALPPKFIPSFSWGPTDRLTLYQAEKALDVASRAMSRRGIQVTDAYARVFHQVFHRTADERAGTGR
jgi:UDP-N-acetylglucosamine diphosphorylase / glucose-1-phosphate thymidylyltransferase / UDP-N-acetylgalactosamine diphosphorylase / glucosamine-1-phosphate N-acetyltransferase / galactosamine-1-phosphate N-acetyltransferase